MSAASSSSTRSVVPTDSELPKQGVCFGFAIHSSLDFLFLRGGAGQPMTVTAPSAPPDRKELGELIQHWDPTPEAPEAYLYGDGAGFQLQIAGTSWFLVDTAEPRVTLPDATNTVRREERLWGIPSILCFLARGDLQLHAAAIEIDGQAVLIGAPRTHGKTALAATFHNAGFRVLSEDVACIRDLGAPHVIPGPAVLRVRRHTAERIEIVGAHEVGTRDDRVHLAIDPARRGDGAPVPLRAILLLRESEDGFRFERQTPAATVRDLWPLSFNLPTAADRARCFAAITDLTKAIRVQNLYRPFRLEELPNAVSFVADNV